MTKTIVALSGGMDSAVLAYKAVHEFGKENVKLVHFKYGSNHEYQETLAAGKIAESLGLTVQVIDLREIFAESKSSLLGTEQIPEGAYNQDSMKSTIVPFRNGVILSILAALAGDEYDTIALASHAWDHAIYPDCTPSFNQAMKVAIEEGTGENVTFRTPFASFTKKDVAREGVILGVPFEDTYSCYKGGPKHCGRCGTCVERLRALDGFTDYTEYEDVEYRPTVLNADGTAKDDDDDIALIVNPNTDVS